MGAIKYPKRLIEVDLPIKRISVHARREKSIRHGHISTLHIWWARRPMAACRAVICASLWPDPADDLCPDMFRTVAREQMTRWAKDHLTLVSQDSWSRFVAISKDKNKLDDTIELRNALLDFIADFSNWDNSTVPEYLETSRLLTQVAHEALGGEKGTRPLVVDSFAGGGAIPLEALRVGADTFASDLNPIAVLLNKVVLEYIPKYGQILADEVRKWGQWIKDQAEEALSEVYPKDSDGSIPIAYLWARTIQCEGPGCGYTIPLLRTNSLFTKKSSQIKLVPIINSKHRSISFRIERHAIDFHTIKSATVTCPVCGYTMPPEKVRGQIKLKQGGTKDSNLIAVMTNSDQHGRIYRIPQKQDFPKSKVDQLLSKVESKGEIAPSSKVNPHRPSPNARGLSAVTRYGISEFGQLYSERQQITLLVFRRLVHTAIEKVDKRMQKALGTCLILAFGHLVDRNSTLCRWIPQTGSVGYTFSRQALSMVWDFVEINPLAHSGGWTGAFQDIARTIENNLVEYPKGQTDMLSATSHILPDDSTSAFITDPPYYDAIPYADLSDFFYVWFYPLLKQLHPDLAKFDMTPKEDEAIWNPGRLLSSGCPKDEFFYENQIEKSLSEARRITQPSGIGVVVFAHKSTSGWENLLQGIQNAGWIITASWPIDTERTARTNAIGTASLTSSIHLICRPRENPDGSIRNDDVGDWRDVLAELPARIHEWMPRLAEEGVVGADAIFACLGPALEIYSRYSSVEKASGEKVELKEYLEEVWAAVSREALNMIFEGADASGFEEDARLTAMWLWTLKTSTNGGNGGSDEDVKILPGYTLEYDAARKIAQGLGAHLEKLSHLVEIKGDTAMLLSTAARAHYLFGKDAVAESKRTRKKDAQQMQFIFGNETDQEEEEAGGVWAGDLAGKPGSTVLDQLHQSMILFAAGRGEAMKRFLIEEGVGRNPLFWRLAQALSALYPKGTDEKRWVDGVLARKKGLGL